MLAALLIASLATAPVGVPDNYNSAPSLALHSPSIWDRGEHVSRQRVARGLDRADNLTLGEFWATSALYGLVSAPAFFSGVAHLDQTTSLLLTPATLAASLGGAYFLTHRDQPLRGGTLAAINYGILSGYLQGALLGTLISSPRHSDEAKDRWVLGSAFVLSSAGGVAGGLLAHHFHATTHDLALIGTTTLWTTAAALTIPLMADMHNERAVVGTILAGSLLGSGLGVGLASTMNISRARTWVLDLGAVAGLGVGAAVAANTGGGPVVSGLTLLAGEVLGLTSAALLSSHMVIPEGRGEPHIKISAGPIPVHQVGGRSSVVPGITLGATL